MTYAEELIQEGRRKGERKGQLKGRVDTIEDLLRAGVEWPVIESATGIDQDALREFKEQLAGLGTETEEPDSRPA